jgi:methylmalonyl-CoA mutase
MTMNGAVLPVMALYIVAAEEQGVAPDSSRARSRTTSSRSSWSATPTSTRRRRAMRIIADIFRYTSENMPGSTASPSPATTCRKPARRPTSSWPTRSPTGSSMCAPASRGLDVDAFCAAHLVLLGDRHELLHGGRQAARRPPALGRDGQAASTPRTPRASRLRTHSQTSGWSLTAQDVRTTTSCAPASRRWPRRRGTPRACTPTPRRGAGAADRVLRPHRAEHPAVPAAGDRHLPRRRPVGRELLCRAPDAGPRRPGCAHIREVEDLGGMAEGHRPRASPRCGSRRPPRGRRRGSTRAADRRRRQQVPPREKRTTSRSEGRQRRGAKAQIESLKHFARSAIRRARTRPWALVRVAETGEGNLLEACVDAARAHATVGEMSEAMEKVFGRHKARTQAIAGRVRS